MDIIVRKFSSKVKLTCALESLCDKPAFRYLCLMGSVIKRKDTFRCIGDSVMVLISYAAGNSETLMAVLCCGDCNGIEYKETISMTDIPSINVNMELVKYLENKHRTTGNPWRITFVGDYKGGGLEVKCDSEDVGAEDTNGADGVEDVEDVGDASSVSSVGDVDKASGVSVVGGVGDVGDVRDSKDDGDLESLGSNEGYERDKGHRSDGSHENYGRDGSDESYGRDESKYHSVDKVIIEQWGGEDCDIKCKLIVGRECIVVSNVYYISNLLWGATVSGFEYCVKSVDGGHKHVDVYRSKIEIMREISHFLNETLVFVSFQKGNSLVEQYVGYQGALEVYMKAYGLRVFQSKPVTRWNNRTPFCVYLTSARIPDIMREQARATRKNKV